jgi:hypothetical protein
MTTTPAAQPVRALAHREAIAESVRTTLAVRRSVKDMTNAELVDDIRRRLDALEARIMEGR